MKLLRGIPHEHLTIMFDKVLDTAAKLFDMKNRQYGSTFLSHGRVGMFIELTRKFNRYALLFEKEYNSIHLKGNPDVIIPSLIDLLCYCVLAIMVEFKGMEYEEAMELLSNEVTAAILSEESNIHIPGNTEEEDN